MGEGTRVTLNLLEAEQEGGGATAVCKVIDGRLSRASPECVCAFVCVFVRAGL